MKLNRAKPELCWLRPSSMSIGTLRLACVALLALTAAAAPATRLSIPGRHVAAAPVFRPIIPDRYVVVLNDPPVAARFPARADADSSAAADYRRQIEAKQAAVVSELAGRHIQVTSRVSHLLNALFVSAPGHSIDELRAIPGVKSVTPMRRTKAHLNRALQLMDAQTAWNMVGGQSNAGKGIKIAVLDSGIDLTNPAFQDSSLTMPSGFPVCSGFPVAPLPYPTSGPCSSYTNSKVIVARSYMQLLGAGSGTSPAANSDPDDPFPHDRYGHGIATAMIAAGNTITTPAISTTGSAITMQGMAPKAYIGVYKIADTFGYSNEEVEIQALGDAVKDGMDVILMPYGALALTNWANDPTASAFEQAATAARPSGSLGSTIAIPVIVTAAGDDGAVGVENNYAYPNFNTISSPSNAPDVISVGATTNSHIMQPSVSVTAAGAPSNVKNIVALAGDSYFYPSVDGANTAPLVDVSKIGDPTACTTLPAGSLNNSFALIVYSSCSFDTAASNAQTAGAVGFVFILPAGTAVAPFDDTSAPSGINEYGPSVAISSGDGQNLKNYIDANPNQQVTIDLAGQEQDVTTLSPYWVSIGGAALTANMVPGYSSFGPTPDGQLKPDIVATGGWDTSYSGLSGGFYVPTQSFDAYDSALYSANGFMAVDGTSFSAALTAGAAALAIQAHPGLRGTQVRSLIVNSSAQTVTTDDSANPVDAEWMGAGMLDAGAATLATVTAEPATISFGILQSSTLSIQKTVTVTNISSGTVTLTQAAGESAPNVSCCTVNGSPGSLPGASITAALSSTTLAPGATSTLTVTLSGSLPAAGEYSGSVAVQNLHIPFMLLVGSGTNCSSSTDNCNLTPNFAPEYIILEGTPGTDFGAFSYLQVTDPYGVPVAGASVTFTQFGWVWLDVVLGSSVSQPVINYSAAGFAPDYFDVNIQAAPTVSVTSAGVPGVVDAAAGLTTIAPGSYVEIFGGGFTSDLSGSSDEFGLFCNGVYCPYPINFDNVSVSFDVPGATYPGFPYFIATGQYPQINLLVPWELEGQSSAQVKVSFDALYGSELFSNVVTVPIANYVPAFFLCSGAVCARDNTTGSVITASNPAKRGQYIQLYANGLGPVTNQPPDGVAATASPLSQTPTTPVVTIGGATVPASDVAFGGLAPGFPALYQINVKVPATAQTGNAVPITLQIGGTTSPTSTVIGPVTIAVQ
ncbi:MAG: S8 family serine peptidase [Bryobacteraceae bacterium]